MEDAERREPDGGDDGGAAGHCSVTCSICLDPVLPDSFDRTVVTLRCGHQFHLDCIGSAFNFEGVTRCPNCRDVEKGKWLYWNGHRGSDHYLRDYDERPLRNRASSLTISVLEARVRRSQPGDRARVPIRIFQPSGPFPTLAITADVVNTCVSPASPYLPIVPRAHHLPIFPQNRRRLYPRDGRLGGQLSVNLAEQRSTHQWQLGYGPWHHYHPYQHRAHHAEEGSSSPDGGCMM